MSDSLADVRAKRRALIEGRVERAAAVVNLSAEDVTPKQKKQLHGLLKHYANQEHPFRACVKDNTKRFGPDGAARVCATLKDIIRGQKKWRGKGDPNHADHGRTAWAMSEDAPPVIDDELRDYILALPDEQVAAIVAELGSDG